MFSKSVQLTTEIVGFHFARRTKAVLLSFFTSTIIISSANAQIGPGPTDSSPTIETDVSSLIATGGGYDAWTGSATRHVVDFEVPGAVGEQGLRWERTYNSSSGGGGWAFSYAYQMSWRPYFQVVHVAHPDGRQSHFEVGTKDRLFNRQISQVGDVTQGVSDLYLGDGSVVHFDHEVDRIGEPGSNPPPYILDTYTATSITDRFGHSVDLYWAPVDAYNSKLTGVSDSSGRWISVEYNAPTNVPGYLWCPTRVVGSDGHWVNYTWEPVAVGTVGTGTMAALTRADYSDGTSATYTYGGVNWGLNGGNRAGVMLTAQDNRASTPMQQISYEYNQLGSRFAGQILNERHYPGDVIVSNFSSNSDAQATAAVQTETRGDGAFQRKIRMEKLNSGGGPPFVTYKTDYNNVQEQYFYNANFFVNKIVDRLGNPTTFNLESNIGNPTQRMHPDGTHIDYTYTDPTYPYYLNTVSDENQQVTTFLRNPLTAAVNPNMIYQVNYPDGGFETFSYNNDGRVVTHRLRNNTTDNRPRYVHFAYDPTTHLPIKEWNPTTTDNPVDSEPHITYEYYGASEPGIGNAWQDRVKSKTPPANAQGLINKEVYEYDRALAANGQTLPNGIPVVETQAGGAPVSGRGLITKIVYPNDNGNSKSFTYDQFGNKKSETDELHHPTKYNYDEYNRPITTIDALNHTTTMQYTATSGASAASHTTKSVRKTISPVTDAAPNGITTGHTYDSNFRLASTIQAEGTSVAATTTFSYDANGNQLTATDPRGNVATNTYDTRNRKTKTVGPAPLNQTTQWAYDSASNVLTLTRPDSTAEVNTYDSMHRVLTHTDGDAAHVTTFTYFPSGKMQTVKDAKNQVTTFTYNVSDLKTQMLYPNNIDHQDYAYDNVFNLTSRRTASGVYQVFTYDARNRKASMGWHNSPDPLSADIAWANGIDKSTFLYDAAGRMVTAQNNFSTVVRGYDNANKLTSDQQTLAGGVSKTVQYVYDLANENTQLYVNDGNGYDRTFTYDPMGRFSQIRNTADNAIWFQYTYDGSSNEIQRSSVLNGVNQAYTRDQVNRMTQRDLKIGAASPFAYEAYSFDSMNRLTAVDRENNKRDGFGYNAPGELTSAQYDLVQTTPTPTPTPTPTATPALTDGATYVSQSVPSSMTPGGSYAVSVTMRNSGTSTWTSADLHRLGSQNPQDNGTWGLGRVTLPGAVAPGAQVTFSFTVTAPSTAGTYNFQWRMVHDGVAWFGDYTPNVSVSVGNSNQVAPVIITASAGDAQVFMSTATTGAIIFYTKNSTGFVNPTHNGATPTGTTLKYTGPIGVVATKYFSAVAYLAGMTDSGVSQYVAQHDSGGLAMAGASMTLLASGTWSSPRRSVTYTLDLVGNRTNVADNGVNTGYTPDVLNQYTSVGTQPVTNTTAHQIGAYQANSYQYVGDSYVAAMGGPGSYTLGYDALGRCVKRTLTGVTTYYIYDGEKPILEYTSTGAIAGKNVYGHAIDEILMRTDYVVNPGGLTYYYQDDHEGSITHLTNASGAVLETYKYDAFGAVTIRNGSGALLTATAYNNRFLFTGREYIQQFGIYEYRARTYHPGLGRFMSEDPKGFDAGDYNLFRYCKNDPEDLTDPMGLQPPYQPGADGMPGPNPVPEKERDASKQFSAAVDKFSELRKDAKGIPAKDILHKGTEDAKQAVQDSKDNPHAIQRNGTIQNRMEERGYSEFSDGHGGLQRAGSTTGSRNQNDQPEVGLPYDRSGNPGITGSHSHVPGAGPSLDRDDRSSALGHPPNKSGVPFVSFVAHTGDSGQRVVVFVPTGSNSGQFFHTYNGQSVYSGQ